MGKGRQAETGQGGGLGHDGDRGHLCGLCSLKAGEGVFNDDAPARGHAEGLGGQQEALGVGLGTGGRVAVDDDVEKVRNVEHSQHPAGVARGRDHTEPDAVSSELFEKHTGTGNQVGWREAGDELGVVGVLAIGQIGFLLRGQGSRAGAQEQIQAFNARNAAEGFVGSTREGQTKLISELLPGEVVVFGGVDQNAVQIEKDRAGKLTGRRNAKREMRKHKPAGFDFGVN